MLIVLDVLREQIDPLNDWVACEAFKLVERRDGVFELFVTVDLAGTLKGEARRAAQEAAP